MAEIIIKNVTKKFQQFQALNSINLRVKDQEFMILLGASGCGKTTLLRIIAGLETQTEGEIWIGGKRIDHLPPSQRGIAMVFQNYAIFPHLNVFENIAFGLRVQKFSKTVIKVRVQRVAELMHIEQLLKRFSSQLSGGQRQRVAVARALAMEPDVLLMDEPLSNLDALLRLEMRAELKGVLATSRTTTIYVTHDQVEAMSLADRIAVINQGQIIQAAPPIEVYRNPASSFVGSFIGSPPMNFLTAEKQQAGKWRVGGITLNGPTTSQPQLNCGIRPEDIQLTSSGSGFSFLVKVVEPLGAHTLLTGLLQDSLFRVIVDSDSQITTGQKIQLSPVQSRVRWYDLQSNQNIALV